MGEARRTQVAIVGAGPAGLLLGRLLAQAGVDAVILEARDRAYVEARQRAGILEQGTMDTLERAGVGERMLRERLVHDGVLIRFGGESHRIDLHGLTGRRVAIYAQTEVVKDLVAARLDAGLALEWEVADVAVDPATGTVTYRRDDEEHTLHADVVAGCDGFHGVCRAAARFDAVAEREYPFSWLGILADAPPVSPELIYAHSPRGFALASMRSEQVVRLYLQVPNGESPDGWDDERIWSELDDRLGLEVPRGPITDRSVTPMRSSVAGPLRHDRLVLAGDAAHIVPPTGAKGLNLAAADVTLLADALLDHLGGDAGALDAWSARALRRVWRAEHFSWWMTSTLHTAPGADLFDAGLQRSQLEYLATSRAAQLTLAENYVGMPL